MRKRQENWARSPAGAERCSLCSQEEGLAAKHSLLTPEAVQNDAVAPIASHLLQRCDMGHHLLPVDASAFILKEQRGGIRATSAKTEPVQGNLAKRRKNRSQNRCCGSPVATSSLRITRNVGFSFTGNDRRAARSREASRWLPTGPSEAPCRYSAAISPVSLLLGTNIPTAADTPKTHIFFWQISQRQLILVIQELRRRKPSRS